MAAAVTARVLTDYFVHEHNALDVAKQEYELAKRHVREVLKCRQAGNTRHELRFQDALARRDAALDRFVVTLCR